jgi:hypothetical protein
VDEGGGGRRTRGGSGSGQPTACWAGLPEVNRRTAVGWLAVLASRAMTARAPGVDPAGIRIGVAAVAGDGNQP